MGLFNDKDWFSYDENNDKYRLPADVVLFIMGHV